MLRRAAFLRFSQPLQAHSISIRRQLSTAELSNGVTMAYDLHEPPAQAAKSSLSSLRTTEAAPIVFIHGLFGSRRNNRTMSMGLFRCSHTPSSILDRIFARDLKRPVYAIDCRNHGDSSHHPTHTYDVLAEDVELFMQHFRMRGAAVIGHSMGAKAAMAVALRGRAGVAGVVAVDNAPVDAALRSDFGRYTRAMRRIEEAAVGRQSEADAILAEYEPELAIRQFLLTNLDTRADGTKAFRIPMRTLEGALAHMGDFPFKDPDETRFEGATLVVRGTKSAYVADEMLPVFGRFFPKFRVVDIEAGHWLISEKPEEFRRAVVDFLQDKE